MSAQEQISSFQKLKLSFVDLPEAFPTAHSLQASARAHAEKEPGDAGEQGAAVVQKIGVIALNNPPANTFSLEEVKELRRAISVLEGDGLVRGMILTSGVDNFFTAGVDLTSFSKDEEWLKEFWIQVTELFRQMYTSRLLSVAALNGHSLALGGVLMLACNDRYALDGNQKVKGKYKFGLNEVLVGLPLPSWLSKLLVNVVGFRNAELLGVDGLILSANDAKQYGLVDKVFASQEELFNASVERLRQRTKIPPSAQLATLQYMRSEFIEEFDKTYNKHTEAFVKHIKSKETQAVLKQALKNIGSKKAN
ncbi:hypothetical protein BB560_005286 [Smittium megazygosporum]|uniref:Enoyl-CoA hydratase n=1 Tax=Smittium megazygosporum TaxID=133381 RepID=A0A2T9Z6W9_9FUNG|nr:hypothetical protein BB560_005286 [Smittium megazygosporum]